MRYRYAGNRGGVITKCRLGPGPSASVDSFPGHGVASYGSIRRAPDPERLRMPIFASALAW